MDVMNRGRGMPRVGRNGDLRRELEPLGNGGSPGPEETIRAFQEHFRRKPWLGVTLSSRRRQEQGVLFRMRCDIWVVIYMGSSQRRSQIQEKLQKCSCRM